MIAWRPPKEGRHARLAHVFVRYHLLAALSPGGAPITVHSMPDQSPTPLRRASTALLLAAAALLTLSACSSGYDTRWKAAVHSDNMPYFGAWQGRWTSSRHPGEGGRLLCVLSPTGPQGHGEFLAAFKANWRHIFSSTHEVVLHTQPVRKPSKKSLPTLSFTGTAALNLWIGKGTYHCEGTLTPTSLHADYDATYDAGTLDLTRVQK